MTLADIVAAVSAQFIRARDNGDVLFFPSTVAKHNELGVEFEIRVCPALEEKTKLSSIKEVNDIPTNADPFEKNQRTQADPFMPPYNPNLHIGDLQDLDGTEYAILLNKYSVLPGHFLLVTKEFQSQSSPLTPPELLQTYRLLAAARETGKEYLAFYNCGHHSGASQPHKHIQFIPVEKNGAPLEVLAKATSLEALDKPFSLTKLKYANHVCRLPPSLWNNGPQEVEDTLAIAFLSLLDLAISTIRHDPDYPPGKPSYSVLISLDHIHLIPRRQDTYSLQATYRVGVNALGFAGMMLAKSDKELEAIKSEGILNILGAVGLDSVHDIQVADASTEPEYV